MSYKKNQEVKICTINVKTKINIQREGKSSMVKKQLSVKFSVFVCVLKIFLKKFKILFYFLF